MLAREGAWVLVGYSRSEREAAQTLERIRAAGGDGEAARIDVTDTACVDGAVRDLIARRARIDVLVCCAGVSRDQFFAMSTEREQSEVIDVNLAGAMRCARA